MILLSMQIVCANDQDADDVAREFSNSHIAHLGLYCWGTERRDMTDKEIDEVRTQINMDQ